VPRRSIEWGSTNDDVYLQSHNGNRRFWPLATGKIDLEGLRRDRLQLLGEAAHYESEGESVVLDEALWPDAKAEQEKRRVIHPWEDKLDPMPTQVSAYDENGVFTAYQIVHTENQGNSGVLEKVSSGDLLEHVLGLKIAQQHRGHTMQLASIMKLLKWQRPDGQRVTIKGVSVRGYHRLIPGASQDGESFP